MTWYLFLLFVHVAGAVTWVGGGLIAQLFASRASGADDPGRLATYLGDIGWIGTRVFLPASLLALVSGVLLVVDSEAYGFEDDWISIAFALYAVSFVVGAFYFGPESGRVGQLWAAGDSDAAARTRRLIFLTRLDLVMLWVIVYAMVVKPEFGDASSVLWGLVGALVVAGLVTWRYRAALARG